MANVRFYRLSQLPNYVAANHQGVFVHLTVTENGHQAGLWFGGSQGWEYLTNDPNAVQIDNKSLKHATSDDASDFDIAEGSIYVKDDFIDSGFTTSVGVGYLAQGTPITRGTTVEDLLKMILTKVLSPSISSNPSISLNVANASGTFFVGTSKTFPAATVNTTNGAYQSRDTGENVDFSGMQPTQPATGVYYNRVSITTSQSGSNYDTTAGATTQGSDSSTDAIASGTVSIAQQSVKLKLGTNKVTYSATGHHTASTSGGICSDGSAGELSIAEGTKTATSVERSYIGVLPFYVNFATGRKQDGGYQSTGSDAKGIWYATSPVLETDTNPTQVTEVYNDTVLRISVGPTDADLNKQLTVWFPAGTVSSVMSWNTLSGKYDIPVAYTVLPNETLTFDGTQYTYRVVKISRSDSPAFADYKFTFSKNQSSNSN